MNRISFTCTRAITRHLLISQHISRSFAIIRKASQAPSWRVNMLYDSECPLCMHEVKFLQKRDSQSLIKFTDIAAPDYDPSVNGDVSYETGMRRIHAVKSSGEVVAGVEVFRLVYEAVGLGWVWRFTKVPWIGAKSEKAYDFWAKWRMWITGRPELEEIFAQRKLVKCDQDKCSTKI